MEGITTYIIMYVCHTKYLPAYEYDYMDWNRDDLRCKHPIWHSICDVILHMSIHIHTYIRVVCYNYGIIYTPFSIYA